MTPDSNGILYLEETDPITPFQTTINALQSATSNVLGALLDDTGQISLNLHSNASGNVYGRRVGNVVMLYFEGLQITSGSQVADVPAALRPSSVTPNPRGALFTTGTPPTPCRITVSSVVTLFGWSAATPYYGSITYLA